MNKIYRIIWSKTRNAYIVVGETAKAYGKCKASRTPVAQAVVAALLALGGQTAYGVCVTDISGSTGQFDVGAGCSLNVLSSGSVSFVSDAVRVINSTVAGSVTNAGTIASTGVVGFGVGVYSGSSLSGGLTNSGTIQGSGFAGVGAGTNALINGITNNGGTIIGADGIYVQSGSILGGGIINSGRILGQNRNGIYLYASTIGGDIANSLSGTISGNSTGIRVESGSSISGSIKNSGLILGTNKNGIFVTSSIIDGSVSNGGTITPNWTGLYFSHTTIGGGVTNSGTIIGGSQSAVGLALTASLLNGGVTNTGLIQGNGRAGVAIWTGSTVIGRIDNSGAIIGIRGNGLEIDASSLSGGVTNSGLIQGDENAGIGIWAGSTMIGNIDNSGRIVGKLSSVNFWTGSQLDGSIINRVNGVISNSLNTRDAIRLGNSSSMTGAITNNGTIQGARGGVGVRDNSTMDGRIVNNRSGIISGATYGVHIEINSTVSGGLSNSGSILATEVASNTTNGGRALHLSTGSMLSGGVTNSGIIRGGTSGLALDTSSKLTGGVINSASGTIAGDARAGIGIGNGSTLAGGITNNGLIVGGTSFGAGGIKIDGSTVSGGITNTGTISGVNGIIVSGASSATQIINAGTIIGSTKALDLSNAANPVTVDNTGTLQGDVYLGSAGNTLNLNGASSRVVGNVSNASASSTVNINDTFTSEGTFNIGAFNINPGGYFNMGHQVTAGQGVLNDGTLNILGNTTQTIVGNYTQTSGGVFRNTVSSDSNFGKLLVTGTVTLPSLAKIDVNVSNPNVVFTGNRLQNVISAGTLNSDGTFSVTDNSLFFDYGAVKDGNTVGLTLTPTAQAVAAVLATGNQPGLGAAQVIDQQVLSNPGSEFSGLFLPLTSQLQASNAISQMLPLMAGGQTQAVLSALRSINRIIQSRQEGHNGGASGDDFYGNRAFWFKPFGSFANQDSRGAAAGYDASTWGVLFGADIELNGVNRLGLAFAYANSNIGSNSTLASQGSNVNTYRLISYGSHSLSENTDVNFQADFGYHNTDESRSISFANRTAKANYDSYSGHIGIGLAHTLQLNASTHVTPLIRVDYTALSESNYNETGAGVLNLSNQGKAHHELIIGLDGKVTHKINDFFVLTANAGVGYDAMNQNAWITSTFAGVPTATFATYGIKPSPWLGRAGFGVITNPGENLELSVRYDGEVRDGFENHTGSIKLRWSF